MAAELGDPADDRTFATVPAQLSQRWSAPIAARLVGCAHLRPGDRVLDLGTGGGVVAAQAARCVGGNGGHVVGVDVSTAMRAEPGAVRFGLPNVDFRCMPAEALDLPDATFDAVLSLLSRPHLRDLAAAVREMRRVLRPGGRAVLGLSGRAPWLSRAGIRHGMRRLSLALAVSRGRGLLAPAWLERILYAEGRVPPGPPRLGAGGLAAVVRAAGFDRLAATWIRDDAVIDSAEEFWAIHAAFSAPVRAWYAAASPEARLVLRDRVRRECARVQAAGGRLVYSQEAVLISARRA